MIKTRVPFISLARCGHRSPFSSLTCTFFFITAALSVCFCSVRTGAQPPPASMGVPFGFQGARYDEETGLYYFRNRYYDPKTGRFLQRDRQHDPENVGNQYAFVGNSPISSLDPMGLKQSRPDRPRTPQEQLADMFKKGELPRGLPRNFDKLSEEEQFRRLNPNWERYLRDMKEREEKEAKRKRKEGDTEGTREENERDTPSGSPAPPPIWDLRNLTARESWWSWSGSGCSLKDPRRQRFEDQVRSAIFGPPEAPKKSADEWARQKEQEEEWARQKKEEEEKRRRYIEGEIQQLRKDQEQRRGSPEEQEWRRIFNKGARRGLGCL